jgi:hypothetical protein
VVRRTLELQRRRAEVAALPVVVDAAPAALRMAVAEQPPLRHRDRPGVLRPPRPMRTGGQDVPLARDIAVFGLPRQARSADDPGVITRNPR